jgi:hypothetical protein
MKFWECLLSFSHPPIRLEYTFSFVWVSAWSATLRKKRTEGMGRMQYLDARGESKLHNEKLHNMRSLPVINVGREEKCMENFGKKT